MPLVRISHVAGKSVEDRRTLSLRVHQALIECLIERNECSPIK